jgi:hypothetical protein
MSRRVLLIVLFLTAAAFLLRVVSAYASIAYFVDTQIVRQSLELSQNLATGRGLDLVRDFKYPLTLTFYLVGVYGVYFGIQLIGRTFADLSKLEAFLVLNRESVHMVAVIALAVLGALLVPLLFVASRRLSSRHTGILAAALGAFNLLLVQFGQQPRPHVPLATLSFAAVLLIAQSIESQRPRALMLAALFSALTVGTLQNGVVIGLPFLAAWLLRPWQPETRRYLWRRLFRPVELVSLALFTILSLLLHPAIVSEYGAVLINALTRPSDGFVLGGGSHTFSLSMFSGANIPLFIRNLYSYQPMLTVLFVPAFLYFIGAQRHHARRLFVACLFPAVNFVVWMLFDNSFPRILAVLVPYLIIVVAFFIEDVLVRFLPVALRWGVIALITLPLAVTSLRMTAVLGTPDTREVTEDWLMANVPAGAAILTDIQLYGLAPTTDAIDRQAADFTGSLGVVWQWMRQNEVASPRFNIVNGHLYLRDEPDPAALVERFGIEYIVVTAAQSRTPDPVVSYARNTGQQIFLICPVTGDAVAELPDDLFNIGWQQIWQLSAPGPIVAVYRVGESPLPADSATSRLCPA